MLADVLKACLQDEANSIERFAENLPPSLIAAVELIVEREGWLVVAGVGKSGHVARKISSTFRSLGRRAVYLHPSEASHGDLGLVEESGVVLALSNSGETSELGDLIAYCTRHNVPMISITSNPDSTLACSSDVCISYGQVKEACINGLAPTVSTTLALAIGDALAVGVCSLANLTAEDFRRYHPGGKLGARLRRVGEVMRSGPELPMVDTQASMGQAVSEMASKSLGCVLIEDNGKFVGIVTDGDIRRNADRLMDVRPEAIATVDPIVVDKDITLEEAALQLSRAKVTVGVVFDNERKILGLIHLHQCVAA